VEADSDRGLRRKTPKRAPHPFLRPIFPRSRFVFLWRDPRNTLAASCEGLSSGKFRTYKKVMGSRAPGPCVCLLHGSCPRSTFWRRLPRSSGSAEPSHPETLKRLDPERWLSLSYRDLIANPAAAKRLLVREVVHRFYTDNILLSPCRFPLYTIPRRRRTNGV